MLLILTAPIQSGKTRWLEALVSELASRGVASYGVVAPGRWHRGPEAGELVKDGIDNVLLPSGERLLVVDELGPLELKRGEGLTHAVRLLERGPAPAWPHAVAVVRPALVPLAKERFQAAWGDLEPIVPGDDARKLVLGLLCT